MISEFVTKKKNNEIEKVSQVFALFFLAVFPLLVGSEGYISITLFKFRTFWIFCLMFVLSCVFLESYYVLNSKKYILKRQSEFKIKLELPQIIMILYVGWTVISAFTSGYGKSTWNGLGRHEGVFSCILYALLFIMTSLWAENTEWFLKVGVVSVAVFSLIGIVQIFDSSVLYPEGYSFWNSAFLSTIGNVDCLGGYFSLFIPFLVLTYTYFESKLWDPIVLICLGIATFLFFFSGVDSGKVGLGVALIFNTPFIFDNKKTAIRGLRAFSVFLFAYFFLKSCGFQWGGAHSFKITTTCFVILALSMVCFVLSLFLSQTKITLNIDKKTWRKIVLISLFAIIIIFLLFLFFYKGDILLLQEASEVMHGQLSDEAGTRRGYIWKTSWEIAKKFPIFGCGPGCFAAEYVPYEIFKTRTDFAHNDFLQIAVCTGFIGLEIYIFFVLTLAFRGLKRGYDCPWVVIYGTCCASYLAHTFFSFSIAIISPVFWVMAGLLEKAERQYDLTLRLQREREEKEKEKKKKKAE